MTVRRALVIANPAARRASRALPRALRTFAAHGVVADAVVTEHPGHARELAHERAPGYDAVFVLGGDGTAMEVLEASGNHGRPVGVLPGGTGNLVARALGTPLRVDAAVRALLAGEERRIDLGALDDGRTFAFAAGVGIDATMLERASPRFKRYAGVLAYVIAATDASLRFRPFVLHATVDGVEHTFHAAAAMVLNFGTVLGGMLQLAPDVDPGDGWLDLCVFGPRTLGDVLQIGWRIWRHRLSEDVHMHFLKGRMIRLATEPMRAAQADGELLGTTPITCVVRPGAARILVPAGGRA
ncbi:MAG: diacylglycerol kinase family lipid kinase [Gemmatimonadaceae bacterium]|nr:diacylglycerol kinase family lipid kinase [Gemmatimonadaceae bacterium]